MNDERGDSSASASTWIKWGISILNGLVGDYLHDRGNGLATPMAFYHHGQPLTLTPDALHAAHPNPTPKICVLIHGLGSNEGIWIFPDAVHNEPGTSYASLLQKDLGYTPFSVRYNSGLHISENGKALATLLDELVACYPLGPDEIVLIGHSMGGLVARSACYYGGQRECTWVQKVKRVFYLGTPHCGADVEKLGYLTTATLRAVPNPITRLIGDVLNTRSQGIKDLRCGNLLDEDWMHAPGVPVFRTGRKPVPWLAGAQHYVIVGTLTADPGHIVSLVLGDALVRPPRIGRKYPPGRGRLPLPSENIKLFPRVHHIGLAHDRDVYAQIRLWCENK